MQHLKPSDVTVCVRKHQPIAQKFEKQNNDRSPNNVFSKKNNRMHNFWAKKKVLLAEDKWSRNKVYWGNDQVNKRLLYE